MPLHDQKIPLGAGVFPLRFSHLQPIEFNKLVQVTQVQDLERVKQMASIKSADRISNKYATVTPQRANEYAEGVKNPRTDWATAAAAAEENFKSGVTAAANAGRFGKGVRKAGSAKWLKGATDKGTVRFGAGVALAKDAYQAGFDPYRQAIESLTLPPRFARRDPRNLQRVTAIATKLGAVKEAQGK
jgi:hypothetical protein